MEKQFVHLMMIGIIITCPVRCMVQGCGSYSSCTNCAPSIELSMQMLSPSCCCQNESDNSVPGEPCEKCQCKCFCSGATIPDTFQIETSQNWQPTFSIDQTISQDIGELTWANRPPDDPGGFGSENIGRAIRIELGSLQN